MQKFTVTSYGWSRFQWLVVALDTPAAEVIFSPALQPIEIDLPISHSPMIDQPTSSIPVANDA